MEQEIFLGQTAGKETSKSDTNKTSYKQLEPVRTSYCLMEQGGLQGQTAEKETLNSKINVIRNI